MSDPVNCPRCHGSGKTAGPVHVYYGPDRGGEWLPHGTCSLCEGAGRVSSDTGEAMRLGEALRAHRKHNQMSMMEQGRRLNLTPSIISALSNGKGGMAAWYHPMATSAWLVATGWIADHREDFPEQSDD